MRGQWCRCLETARLRAFLAALPTQGPPVVLVTHQFTINVFTEAGTVSGGGSLFQLNGTGSPRLLGAIQAN